MSKFPHLTKNCNCNMLNNRLKDVVQHRIMKCKTDDLFNAKDNRNSWGFPYGRLRPKSAYKRGEYRRTCILL